MKEAHDKGTVKHLNKHILKYDKRCNLVAIVGQTHQLYKWLDNKDTDKILSNDFWKDLITIDKLITSLIKF